MQAFNAVLLINPNRLLIYWLSYKERRVDALALRADERRDKLRKASGRSKYPLIRRCPNGETHLSKPQVSIRQSITYGREPGELKHLSTRRRGNQSRDSPSSGERKGTDGQTVERAYPAGVPPTGLQGRASGGCRPRAQVRLGSGTAWEGRPQRVTAPYANPDRTARRGP